MIKGCLLSLCFSVWLSMIYAQDSIFAKQIICTLASPSMAGRNIEKGGNAKAAAYLSRCLSNIGIPPVDEQYYQPFTFTTFAMEGNLNVRIGNQKLSPFTDYRIADYSASQHAKLKIVSLSPNVLLSKNKMQLEKWQKKTAADRARTAVYLKLPYLTSNEAENKELQQAISQLRYINPFQTAALIVENSQFPPQSLEGGDYMRNFTTVYLRNNLLKRVNKKISIDLNNQQTLFATQNVCALEQGIVDTFIVFTAHYDHLGAMGNQVYYPGAHDNASGCAAVLDLARYFHNNPLKYSVLYIFFSGEESGLLGSKFFVENPLIDLSKIKLLINLDMFCGGTDGLMFENVLSIDSGRLYQNLINVNEQYKWHTKLAYRANAPNSDHYPFTLKEVPAIFIYTLGGRYGGYHAPEDTCENCGLEEYEQSIKLIIEGIKKYLNSD